MPRQVVAVRAIERHDPQTMATPYMYSVSYSKGSEYKKGEHDSLRPRDQHEGALCFIFELRAHSSNNPDGCARARSYETSTSMPIGVLCLRCETPDGRCDTCHASEVRPHALPATVLGAHIWYGVGPAIGC